MTYAISATNLSKRYVIQHAGDAARMSFRQALLARAKDLIQGRVRDWGTSNEDFWALKDVSFDVEPGERIGVIGRNGAGKSTLLKILSRITDPTEGRVEIRGRVSSLLEVGTGFHPELTGRENIFLNGTILGMTTREIRRKFDEIVAFAEIERFLDTPVKRYSSGMYVRLAFAVAAHLEPDILVIDEVLAVGDAQFQKKCLGKMRDVTGEGRTVIFVSHNMTTVTSLCSQSLLLESGRVKAFGSSSDVAALYFASQGERTGSAIRFLRPEIRPGDEVARLIAARFLGSSGEQVDHIRLDQPAAVEMTFEVLGRGKRIVPNFHVMMQGQYAFVSSPAQSATLAPGTYKVTMRIPARLLNEGRYSVGLALTSADPVVVHFFEQEALEFHVIDDLNDPHRNDYTHGIPGVVRPRLDWEIDHIEVETYA